LASGEAAIVAAYFFLPAADWAATAALFFWFALLVLACFCEDFFWLDFGDLSPIIFSFGCWSTRLRHGIFSEGNHIVLARAAFVNGGEGISQRRRGLIYPFFRSLSTRSMQRSGTSHWLATKMNSPLEIHTLTNASGIAAG
jgi:hypothetical protein